MPFNTNLRDIVLGGIAGTLNPNAFEQAEAERNAAFEETRKLASTEILDSPAFLGLASHRLKVPVSQLLPKTESVQDIMAREGTEGLMRIVTTPGGLSMKTNPDGTPSWSYTTRPVATPPTTSQMVGRAETLKRIPFIEQNPDLLDYLNSVASSKVKELSQSEQVKDAIIQGQKIAKDTNSSPFRATYDILHTKNLPIPDDIIKNVAEENIIRGGFTKPTTSMVDAEIRRLSNLELTPQEAAMNRLMGITSVVDGLIGRKMLRPEDRTQLILEGAGIPINYYDPQSIIKRMNSTAAKMVALKEGKNSWFDPDTNMDTPIVGIAPSNPAFAGIKDKLMQGYSNEISLCIERLKQLNVDPSFYSSYSQFEIQKNKDTNVKKGEGFTGFGGGGKPTGTGTGFSWESGNVKPKEKNKKYTIIGITEGTTK
jgi:hypothetical protein